MKLKPPSCPFYRGDEQLFPQMSRVSMPSTQKIEFLENEIYQICILVTIVHSHHCSILECSFMKIILASMADHMKGNLRYVQTNFGSDVIMSNDSSL